MKHSPPTSSLRPGWSKSPPLIPRLQLRQTQMAATPSRCLGGSRPSDIETAKVSETQQHLPDIGVRQSLDVVPHFAHEIPVARDFGEFLDLFFPGEADAGLDAWRRTAGHAGQCVARFD